MIIQSSATRRSRPSVASGYLQLAPNHFTPAKFSPVITFPRPNTETNTYAYCRNAYPGLSWEIPIVVYGGAWPFYYEMTSGPAGMDIVAGTLTLSGEVYVIPSGYGILRWSNPTTGTHSITVRVTDQDGTQVSVSWDLVVGTTGHVFIDAVNGNDANDGSFANPYQTFFNGMYGGADADATHATEVAHFYAGTYTINTDSGNNAVLDNNKPRTYVAVSGESVTFSMASAHMIAQGQASDLFFGGINFDGDANLANNRIIQMASVNDDRLTWYNCNWNNNSAGTVDNDNPACIMLTDDESNPSRQYVSVVDCSIGAACEVNLIDAFDCDYIVVERNNGDGCTIPGGNGDFFIQMKDNCSQATVRANSCINATFSGRAAINWNNQEAGAKSTANQETCWNVCEVAQANNTNSCYHFNSHTSAAATNVYCYRNVAVCTTGRGFRFYATNGDEVVMEDNASYGENGDYFGTYTDGGNNPGLSSTDFDTSAKLTGTARTTYLGTTGNEVQ